MEEEAEEGEMREMECQVPTASRRRRERLKPGNLKGKSLTVSREQKIGPLAQLEDNPWVWSNAGASRSTPGCAPSTYSPISDPSPFPQNLCERERGFCCFGFGRRNWLFFEF